MDVRLLVVKSVRRLRQVGFRATLGEVLGRVKRARAPEDFDLRHGTDTGGIEPLWKFKISSANARFGVAYQATGEEELKDAVDFLHEDLQNFTFIDLGCGKGRALMVASTLGFKQVIGVEFVHELAEIARMNLARMRIANAVVRHADAAEFQFPNSDMVVFLYNPFSQEVMRKVVANLREFPSKRLYVIYRVPECAEVFDSSGFLSPLGSPPARRNIQIYKATKPPRCICNPSVL